MVLHSKIDGLSAVAQVWLCETLDSLNEGAIIQWPVPSKTDSYFIWNKNIVFLIKAGLI